MRPGTMSRPHPAPGEQHECELLGSTYTRIFLPPIVNAIVLSSLQSFESQGVELQMWRADPKLDSKGWCP